MLMGGLAVAGWVQTPALARAHCGDDCTAPLPYSVAHPTAVVAVDGVLGFAFAYGRGESALEFLTVTVRDAEGEEVAGTLVANAEFSVLVWRPEAPWVAGATYTVVTLLDTDGWAGAMYGARWGSCSTRELEREITIDAAALPAPQAAPITVNTDYRVRRSLELDSMVCCDGGLASRGDSGHGSCPSVELRGDSCFSRRDHGTMKISYGVDGEGLAPAVAGNLVVRASTPEGEPYFEPSPVLDEPTCVRFESLDLARGEVFVEERCLGAELELGDIEVDPSPAIAKYCEGPAYVCEAGNHRWDEDACKTWPDGEAYEYVEPVRPMPPLNAPIAAGGCAIGREGAGFASLGLVALVLVGRRRRRG